MTRGIQPVFISMENLTFLEKGRNRNLGALVDLFDLKNCNYSALFGCLKREVVAIPGKQKFRGSVSPVRVLVLTLLLRLALRHLEIRQSLRRRRRSGTRTGTRARTLRRYAE